MHSTDPGRTKPWWLAVGLGTSMGVLAGLSFTRPLPLALASALVGAIALRGHHRFATLNAGAACGVCVVLSLDPAVPLPARLGLSVAYGTAAAGIMLAVWWYGGRRTVAGAAAAVIAAGLVVAPVVALRRDLHPIIVAERDPAVLAVDAAQEYLAGEVRDGRLPGLVFGVAEHGQVIRYAAFGTTRPGGEPIRHTTRFRIGSMSKSFTALAVLRLANEGLIDLDKPVADYLDWFDVQYPPGRGPITVAELLHHDSGIANSAGWEFLAGSGPDPLEDLKKGLADNPLLPADEVEYANANYILAAQIIEAVTGQTYADYLTEQVLTPLGLTATTPTRPTGSDLAEGYRMWFGTPVRSTAPFLDFAVPAGFITSNAVDLLSYLDDVVRSDNPIVTSTIRRTLLDGTVSAPQSGVGEPFAGQRYAKGWVRGPIAGSEVIWHSGGLADFNSVMVSHPQGDWAFVILINTASQISSLMPAITENVTAILTGSKPPRASAATTLTNTYLVVDLALVAATLALAWGATMLTTPGRRRRRLRVPFAVGVINIAVLAALAVLLPTVTGFPARPLSPADQASLARVLTTYVPDVGWSLLIIATTSAILAVVSILALLGRRRGHDEVTPTSCAPDRPTPTPTAEPAT